MIKKLFNTFLSTIISFICIIIMELVYVKKIIQMCKRRLFLKHHPDYIDMYSNEAKRRIYEFKFKSNVYEEQ